MKAFLGLLLILLSTVSYSQGYDYNQKTFKLAEVELLSTEASQYQCGFCAHRNPYVLNRIINGDMALNIQQRLMFWKPKILTWI